MNAEIKKKRASASSLFLMELVVAILFFTLAASLCITIFVRAHIQSERAKELNRAVNLCSDTAELIRTSKSISEATAVLKNQYALMVPGSKSGELYIYFDEDYNMIMSHASNHKEIIQLTESDGRMDVKISFTDASGYEVYGLSFVHALQ